MFSTTLANWPATISNIGTYTVESRPYRRTSYKKSEKTVKFFFKVVLPLVEKYFSHHRSYFTAQATISNAAGVATIKEKESVAALFCKLASLLRDVS